MLKNAFRKYPPQNRTNVQIKGGGGVKGLLNNVQKNCTFLKWGHPLGKVSKNQNGNLRWHLPWRGADQGVGFASIIRRPWLCRCHPGLWEYYKHTSPQSCFELVQWLFPQNTETKPKPSSSHIPARSKSRGSSSAEEVHVHGENRDQNGTNWKFHERLQTLFEPSAREGADHLSEDIIGKREQFWGDSKVGHTVSRKERKSWRKGKPQKISLHN